MSRAKIESSRQEYRVALARATLARDSRQMHSARVYSRHQTCTHVFFSLSLGYPASAVLDKDATSPIAVGIRHAHPDFSHCRLGQPCIRSPGQRCNKPYRCSPSSQSLHTLLRRFSVEGGGKMHLGKVVPVIFRSALGRLRSTPGINNRQTANKIIIRNRKTTNGWVSCTALKTISLK